VCAETRVLGSARRCGAVAGWTVLRRLDGSGQLSPNTPDLGRTECSAKIGRGDGRAPPDSAISCARVAECRSGARHLLRGRVVLSAVLSIPDRHLSTALPTSTPGREGGGNLAVDTRTLRPVVGRWRCFGVTALWRSGTRVRVAAPARSRVLNPAAHLEPCSTGAARRNGFDSRWSGAISERRRRGR
jgi:hypothetical protein